MTRYFSISVAWQAISLAGSTKHYIYKCKGAFSGEKVIELIRKGSMFRRASLYISGIGEIREEDYEQLKLEFVSFIED